MDSSEKSNQTSSRAFGPEGAAAGAVAELSTDEIGDALIVSEGLDLVGILSAVDETAYVWDIVADTIEWESNAATVLGLDSVAEASTGHAFNMMVAPEHLARRQAAIVDARSLDGQRGVPYRVQYKFQPGGNRSNIAVWIEDHGRWWGGADGKPVRARGVIRVVTESYWEEQRLLYRSDHDELTGQLNRIRLTDALSVSIARDERIKTTSAFLIAAVNNLSVINETFGFDVGDEVIAAIARVIKEKLRGGDTIGRYSSNKFGIILNDCGAGAMNIAAERFMKAAREATIRTSACQLSATISIGGVIVPAQANTVHLALSSALQALDRAKHKRFDCFMAFEPSPSRETARARNIAIADEVISAIDERRMRLVLQPMVDARTRKPTYYECLLRMERPDGSIVSAGEFVPVAEQLGLSRLIDQRVLELSVDLLKRHPKLRLSINVSGLTCTDHEWLTAVQRLTGGRRSITERMIVEITETAAIHDLDQSIVFVDTLKELGCRVAIDDFGAGYTSFRNLKALNVDMVKIDGAFVKNLASDTSDQVFVKTMVELANSFKMETVAEWVSDEDTCRMLTEAGITYLQGFHFGLPIGESELPAQV